MISNSYTNTSSLCGNLFSQYPRSVSAGFFRGFLPLGILLILLFSFNAEAAPQKSAKAHTATEQISRGVKAQIIARLIQWRREKALQPLKTQIKLKLPNSIKQLAVCRTALQVTPVSRNSPLWGMVSMRANCPKPQWQLLIRANVKVKARVPVLQQSQSRGHVLSAKDIGWQWLRLTSSDVELLSKTEQLVGMQVSRHIRANLPINPRQVTQADLVSAGQQVTIEVKTSGFVARMPGQALENGIKDQGIRVRNLSSGKIITAYPSAPGIVTTRF